MAELRTHGYGGWWEMRQFRGKTRTGEKVGTDVLRNMGTGEVVMTEKGHNAEPPHPTGDCSHLRHRPAGSDELWESLRNREPSLELISEKGAIKTYRMNA